MTFGIELIVIAAMLLLNAVFAAFEIALASVTRTRLQTLAREGRRGAAAGLAMKERMEGSLAIVQVGITLAAAIAAAFGGAGMEETVSPLLQQRFGLSATWSDVIALVLFVVPLSAVTIVFAELVPKMIAIGNPERVVLALSPAMKTLGAFFYPLVRVLEVSVQLIMRIFRGALRTADPAADHLAELQAAASLARSSRLIGPLEEKIVHAAAVLSRRTLQSVMIPAESIIAIPQDARLSEALILAHQYMHTRFPVIARAGDAQTISGYVNFKDIVTALRLNPADPSIRGIRRPLLHLPATTTLSAALEHMTTRKEHMVLVTEGAQRNVGLATLEDLITELLGDMGDEYDRLPTHVVPVGSGWIMGGGVPMATVMQTVGGTWQEAGSRATLLADWLEQRAAATGGAEIHADHLDVIVRKVRRQRIYEAMVRKGAG